MIRRLSRVMTVVALCVVHAWRGEALAETGGNSVRAQLIGEAFPLAGKETTLKVVLENQRTRDISDLEVIVTSRPAGEGEVHSLFKKTVLLPATNSCSLAFPWKPQENGFHIIQLAARSTTQHVEVFSSQERPVVSRRLFFPWFGNDRRLQYANVILEATPEGRAYWKERGVKTCVWKPGNQVIKDLTSAADYVKILQDGILGSATDGILIDEIGDYDWNLSHMKLAEVGLPGLSEFTVAHPEIFVGVWVSGSLKPALCNLTKNIYRQRGIDLLMLESYFNFQVSEFQSYTRFAYFDQRIAMARDQDVLTSCVLTLGISGTDRVEVTPENLEDQIRYLRQTAPEMPGVGFFFADPQKAQLLRVADELCFKYWILPTVTVWDRDIWFSDIQPKAGQAVRISADIYNIGGMDAHDVIVRFYDGPPAYGGKKIGGDLKVPVVSCTKGIPPGKNVVETLWKAALGYHEIYVQVFPSHNERVTILHGEAKKTISVF